jgi:hypothetical protein
MPGCQPERMIFETVDPAAYADIELVPGGAPNCSLSLTWRKSR